MITLSTRVHFFSYDYSQCHNLHEPPLEPSFPRPFCAILHISTRCPWLSLLSPSPDFFIFFPCSLPDVMLCCRMHHPALLVPVLFFCFNWFTWDLLPACLEPWFMFLDFAFSACPLDLFACLRLLFWFWHLPFRLNLGSIPCIPFTLLAAAVTSGLHSGVFLYIKSHSVVERWLHLQ